MERDFLGLKLKPTDSVVVKDEFAVGGGDRSGFGRSCSVPWPLLPSKMSAFPHFMPPKPQQDEKKPLKMKSTVLPSFDMNKKPSADLQQFHGDNSYLTAATAWNHTSSAGDVSKPSKSGAQFTIFYNGTIHVFDDFSPEKAQAIVFLAGNGSVPSDVSQFKYQMEADKPLVPRSQSMNLPSPFSVPSNTVIDVSAASNSNTKLSPIGSFAAHAMIPSAVPQSRKASLARFLEKRRERAAMNASPYGTSKKASNGAAQGSTGF